RVTHVPAAGRGPTRMASRADAGNAGNGFQSMSSGRTDLNTAWSGWWVRIASGPPDSVTGCSDAARSHRLTPPGALVTSGSSGHRRPQPAGLVEAALTGGNR